MAVRPLSFGVALMLAFGGPADGASKPSGPSHGKPSNGVTYRWVDEKGIVHYGDRVPPQYSQQESVILNNQGVEIGHLAAPKSAAQLAEEARQQQVLMRQKQRDTFLLTTYTSVKDIEQLRDERLVQINGQRAAAEQYIAGLKDRLTALQKRAMLFRPYNDKPNARRMPDDLAEDLIRTLNDMRSQQAVLAAKDEEEAAVRAQFQDDIDRYRELRTPRTATR